MTFKTKYVFFQNSTANEKLSRSATLPISKGPAEPSKSSSTNKSGEMKSKGKKKKTSKPTTNAISTPETQTAQTPKEQTSGVEPAKPDYVMREASQNGEYFVLDKTFCWLRSAHAVPICHWNTYFKYQY